MILDASRELEGKIQGTKELPGGIDPIDHVYMVLNSVLGINYTNLSDGHFLAIEKIIELIKNNPTGQKDKI